MKKAKVALVGMLMLAGSGAYAQTNGIGGTVTDNAGEPIIGASVKVKGSTNMGTVTDIILLLLIAGEDADFLQVRIQEVLQNGRTKRTSTTSDHKGCVIKCRHNYSPFK